jgi:hypothetical protein
MSLWEVDRLAPFAAGASPRTSHDVTSRRFAAPAAADTSLASSRSRLPSGRARLEFACQLAQPDPQATRQAAIHRDQLLLDGADPPQPDGR